MNTYKKSYDRTINKDLSFEGERLTRGRHKIHPYPAMLHPLLVDYLLDNYANNDDVVFDPFCGSGVTLLQSSTRGHQSIGFDINPLALLIAKTKTQRYDMDLLKNEYYSLRNKLSNHSLEDIPTIKNMDYWYTDEVVTDLARIRHLLKTTEYEYKEFFISTFAFICRNQSLTRNGEFKRYRIKKDKISSHTNEVINKFKEHTEEMIKEFEISDIPLKSSKPMLANSENEISKEINYNIVITSPPYGDSRTTVAYGEYSSFGSEWTDDLHEFGTTDYKVDKECLGKKSTINKKIYNHAIFTDILDKIEKQDTKRANDVLNFFNGYYSALTNIVENLASKGRLCFVVGNRNVKGYEIPMDQITASFIESLGLSFNQILVRDILNKVMPSKNSPSNKVGVKQKTMANEYVVIFDKKT